MLASVDYCYCFPVIGIFFNKIESIIQFLFLNRGVEHICLNLDFGKISHRFTRDFTNTDKKIRKCRKYYVKNYLNRKSVEVQH